MKMRDIGIVQGFESLVLSLSEGGSWGCTTSVIPIPPLILDDGDSDEWLGKMASMNKQKF